MPGVLDAEGSHGTYDRSAVLRAIASGTSRERRALTRRLFKIRSGSSAVRREALLFSQIEGTMARAPILGVHTPADW